jgi:hypothetical protein
MLILAAVAAFVVKNAFVDTYAMATGKTPPSHAYRMAKLKEQAAKERRRLAADPDTRGGLRMVARHWYLDACEDVDHWRAHRHETKPERKAARQRRRAERARLIREWAERHVPDLHEDVDSGPDPDDDIIDAEIVDEEPQPRPEEGPRPRPRPERPVPDEEPQPRPSSSSELDVLFPDENAQRPPLPYRRLVLMTMLAAAGYAPNTEAIGAMTSQEVDAAITALIEHERATRATTY